MLSFHLSVLAHDYCLHFNYSREREVDGGVPGQRVRNGSRERDELSPPPLFMVSKYLTVDQMDHLLITKREILPGPDMGGWVSVWPFRAVLGQASGVPGHSGRFYGRPGGPWPLSEG